MKYAGWHDDDAVFVHTLSLLPCGTFVGSANESASVLVWCMMVFSSDRPTILADMRTESLGSHAHRCSARARCRQTKKFFSCAHFVMLTITIPIRLYIYGNEHPAWRERSTVQQWNMCALYSVQRRHVRAMNFLWHRDAVAWAIATAHDHHNGYVCPKRAAALSRALAFVRESFDVCWCAFVLVCGIYASLIITQ